MTQTISLLAALMRTVSNWWVYPMYRLGLSKGEYVRYKLRTGHTMVLRAKTSDFFVFNDIFLDGVYDAPEIPWNTLNTVIDVGAHVGVFALYVASQSPTAKVIAYEPEPTNIHTFRKTVDESKLHDRIIIEPVGIAGEAGELKMHVMPGRGEQNSLYRQTESSRSISVPVTTLAASFEKHGIAHCDLLKVNCEGAEYDMFYGLSDEYFKRIDRIVMNYHLFSLDPKHHPAILKEFLEGKGFTVRKLSEGIFLGYRA